MEKVKRSIFFWTLVVLFLITTPIVVMNARGYRFDFTRGVFAYSGSITFKSNPVAVDIELNDKSIKSKKLNRINGSYNINGLIPDTYDIKISSDNFQTWRKKIDVHSGLANEFWNVVLVKNNYERFDNQADGISKFFISPRNSYIAYTSENQGDLEVNIHDIEKSVVEKIFTFPGWQFISENRNENIEWSPRGNRVSVPVQKKAEEKKNVVSGKINKAQPDSDQIYNYYIADLENNSNMNLNEFLNLKNIKNVRWDPIEKDYIFFLDNNNLYRADLNDSKNIALISDDVSSFDLSSTAVYFTKQSNKILFKSGLDGKNISQITYSFPGDDSEFVSKIVVYDDMRIVLISNNNKLYIFNQGEHDNYFKKIADNISDARFSDDGKKLLFWSSNEIFVYFVRDDISQPAQYENTIQNITRFSENLTNVQWYKDYEHVIFSAGKWTKIIELDPRDYVNCMDLINTKDNNQVVYNDYLEKLFFVDKKNETQSLFSITFPEKTSLLGAVGLDD